jgi:hypothetical protein
MPSELNLPEECISCETFSRDSIIEVEMRTLCKYGLNHDEIEIMTINEPISTREYSTMVT